MAASLSVAYFNPASDTWPAEIDHVRRLLGAPNNSALFPPHFLKATLPKIGGHVALVRRGDRVIGVGFLFPRGWQGSQRVFTLRFHRLGSPTDASPEEIVRQVQPVIAGGRVEFYDPAAAHCFHGEGVIGNSVHDLRVDAPTASDARAIRALQRDIWQGVPDSLYPVDIHSADFGSAQSLVARQGEKLAGFLFGFYAFSGPPLPPAWAVRTDFRLESQLLGVAPAARDQGVATALKRAQALLARRQGIDVVHWTFDPLQFGNAVLNLCRLRAVATVHYPRYYEFLNALNQVAASRLGVTWLVNSRRVQQALDSGAKAEVPDLSADQSTVRVNDGCERLQMDVDAARIAIEIPARWTALQAEAPDLALRWRQATDQLFARYLGWTADRYAITGAGVDGERRYLIAERVDQALSERLGA